MTPGTGYPGTRVPWYPGTRVRIPRHSSSGGASKARPELLILLPAPGPQRRQSRSQRVLFQVLYRDVTVAETKNTPCPKRWSVIRAVRTRVLESVVVVCPCV
eukprot:1662813-Rhodomonas_salina.1